MTSFESNYPTISRNPGNKKAGTEDRSEARIAEMLRKADAVVIAASNGFDISDGYNQFACDEAFLERFGDFRQAYGLTSMLQGLMSRWPSDEARWAFLTRLIDYGYRTYQPSPVMSLLDRLTSDKPRFVITCNCNSRFLKAGFAEDSVFETEGTYAHLRCSAGCCDEDFDAVPYVERLIETQDATSLNREAAPDQDSMFHTTSNSRRNAADSTSTASASASVSLPLSAPTELLPRCPHCGMVLEAAVDDSGRQASWASFRTQQQNFQAFLDEHRDQNVLILELGMGQRNPAIKRPLMAWAEAAPHASYAVLNRDPAVLPHIAPERTAAIAGDLTPALEAIEKML